MDLMACWSVSDRTKVALFALLTFAHLTFNIRTCLIRTVSLFLGGSGIIKKKKGWQR